MIIFYIIPGNVLLLLAGVMVVGSVVFAIWYSIMQAKEESENMTPDDLSVGKRIAILLSVIAVFASIAALAYGIINHNGITGTVGFLGWMAASLMIAYTCSPLRLISGDGGSQQGCGYILFSPLLLIISTVSMILIMLISWIFGLATVLKGLSKRVYAIIAGCVVLLVSMGIGLNFYQQNSEQKEAEYKFQLVEGGYVQVMQAVEAGKLTKIVFDEETKQAMAYYNIESFFLETEVREAVANKFVQLYQNNAWDQLPEYLAFLSANYVSVMEEEAVYDICFSENYLNAFESYIQANGVHKKNDGDNEIYTYQDAEIWFTTFGCYIKFAYMLDGKEESDTEILGNPGYRRKSHRDYDESSPGYFLVGKTVELVEDKIDSSEDLANKYYPAATCPKCGTSFRANTMRARMIANYGYCGMGLCSKD